MWRKTCQLAVRGNREPLSFHPSPHASLSEVKETGRAKTSNFSPIVSALFAAPSLYSTAEPPEKQKTSLSLPACDSVDIEPVNRSPGGPTRRYMSAATTLPSSSSSTASTASASNSGVSNDFGLLFFGHPPFFQISTCVAPIHSNHFHRMRLLSDKRLFSIITRGRRDVKFTYRFTIEAVNSLQTGQDYSNTITAGKMNHRI